MKNLALLVVGMLMGAVVVSNSSLMNEKVVVDKSSVVTGHRVAPNGVELVSYADGHVQTLRF